jgi:AFG3 family protein
VTSLHICAEQVSSSVRSRLASPRVFSRRWGTLAAQLPKGFGSNIGGGSKESKAESEKSKGNEKSSSGKSDGSSSNDSGGGGLGGSKGEGPEFTDTLKLLASLGVGGVSLLILFYSGRINGQEISWQEFRNDVLTAGLVDRLEVVNKDHVRVYLRSTPDPEFLHASQSLEGMVPDDTLDRAATRSVPGAVRDGSGPRFLFFRIGSVETFERQLEDAQIDMRIRPRNFVLVRHMTETDLLTRLSSLLPILMLAIPLIMLSSMMGSAGGPAGKDSLSRMFNIGKAKSAMIKKDAKVKVGGGNDSPLSMHQRSYVSAPVLCPCAPPAFPSPPPPAGPV